MKKLIILLLAVGATSGHAENNYWLGINSDWFDIRNWSLGRYPVWFHDVFIGVAPGATLSEPNDGPASGRNEYRNFEARSIYTTARLFLDSNIFVSDGMTFRDQARLAGECSVYATQTQDFWNLSTDPEWYKPHFSEPTVQVASGQSLHLKGATRLHQGSVSGGSLVTHGVVNLLNGFGYGGEGFENRGLIQIHPASQVRISTPIFDNRGHIEVGQNAYLGFDYKSMRRNGGSINVGRWATLGLALSGSWSDLPGVVFQRESTLSIFGFVNNEGRTLDFSKVGTNNVRGNLEVNGGFVHSSTVGISLTLDGAHLQGGNGGRVILKNGATASGKYSYGYEGSGLSLTESVTLDNIDLSIVGHVSWFMPEGTTLTLGPSSKLIMASSSILINQRLNRTIVVGGQGFLGPSDPVDYVVDGHLTVGGITMPNSIELRKGTIVFGGFLTHIGGDIRLGSGQLNI